MHNEFSTDSYDLGISQVVCKFCKISYEGCWNKKYLNCLSYEKSIKISIQFNPFKNVFGNL